MIQIRPVSDLRNRLTESLEDELDIADKMAEETDKRHTHEEMFAMLRSR